jgi:hypothetical protein
MPDDIPKELLVLLSTQKGESWQWEEKFGTREPGEFWTVFVPNTQETEDAGRGLATPNAAAKREKGESASGQSPDSTQQKKDKEYDKREGTGEVYAKVQEKEASRDETAYKKNPPSKFKETPNPIWQEEEITPEELLTDAQVTSEEHTNDEHQEKEEKYGSREVEYYEGAATNEREEKCVVYTPYYFSLSAWAEVRL